MKYLITLTLIVMSLLFSVIAQLIVRKDSIFICEISLPFVGRYMGVTNPDIFTETFPDQDGGSGSDSTIIVTICEPDVFVWNGSHYNTSGIYTETLTNQDGGDSIFTLDLTVLPITNSTTDTTIHESEAPFDWNGILYDIGGIYTTTLVSATGCDSVLTFSLNIIYDSNSIFDTVICEPEVVLWNGINYYSTGTYTETFTNQAGGDSIVTLNLIVLHITYSIESRTMNDSDAPYIWNGNPYNETGIYHDTISNAVGCDSVMVLDLNIDTSSYSCPPDFNRECHRRIPSIYSDLDEFRSDGGIADGDVIESSFSVVESRRGSCPEVITRVYSVNYGNGNSYSCTQTITVIDIVPPVIYSVPNDLTTQCYGPDPYRNYREFWEAGGSVRDSCSSVDFMHVGDVVSASRPGIIFRTYEFADECDNSVQWVQEISVEDRIPPVLICPTDDTIPADEVSTLLFDTFVEFIDAGGIATDNCEINKSSFFLTSEFMDTLLVPDILTRTYSITDFSGNEEICLHQITIEFNTSVGDEVMADIDFKVYPNPSNGVFKIEAWGFSGEFSIEVVDNYGKLIWKREKLPASGMTTEDINISNVVSGAYYIRINDGDKMMSKSIIKR